MWALVWLIETELTNSPQIPDHLYRIQIICGSGSGKVNILITLINHQPSIDKLYLYAEDLLEAKYQSLIEKSEFVGLRHCSDSKAFIEYSSVINNFYENIDDYNPIKKKHNIDCIWWFDFWHT